MNSSTSNSDLKEQRYGRWLLGLIVGTILLLAGFNYTVDPFRIFNTPGIEGYTANKYYDNERMIKAYDVLRGDYDTLIMGSSRPEYALRPETLEQYGYRTYNLAMPGGLAKEQLGYLKHANRNGSIKTVILGLDLFAYGSTTPFSGDYRESRLLRCDESGCERDVLEDYVIALLTKDAFRNSRETLSNNREGLPSTHHDHGALVIKNKYRTMQDAGGHRQAFRIFEHSFMKPGGSWFNSADYRFRFADANINMLDHLRGIVAYSYQNNIDLKLYISPVHARMLVAMHATGLWPTYQQWKRSMVEVLESEAVRFEQEPFKVWDFGIISPITTETVPAEGSLEDTMTWYWEGSHFKPILGDWILEVVLGHEPAADRPYAREQITHALQSAGMDRYLQQQQQALERYLRDDPETHQEVCGIAIKVGTAQTCPAE